MAERVINPSALVGKTPYNSIGTSTVCASFDGVVSNSETLFSCEPTILGMYVTFYLQANTTLYFHEIEVHGICKP